MKLLVRRIALLLSLATLAAAPTTPTQKEIGALYRKALAGDKEAVDRCIDALETALKSNPDNQLARVYLGSSYTLRSRDLGFGPKKLEALRHGLAIMDGAVSAAPDEPKVRLVRALTNSALPAIFGRGSSARDDFALLAEQAEKTPKKFEDGDLQIIYYRAALAAKQKGDRTRASDLLRKAQTHPDDPALAEKIRDELKAL